MKVPVSFSYQDNFYFRILLFCILAFVMILASVCNMYPSYMISTLIIVLSGIYLSIGRSILSYEIITFVIIFYPALSPVFAWDVNNAPYFSMAATHLQDNLILIDKSVFLYAIATVAYSIIIVSTRKNNNKSIVQKEVFLGAAPTFMIVVISILVVLDVMLLEPGPTILTANYTNILEGRFDSNPAVVFALTVFGGLWAFLFVFGLKNKYIFWFSTIFVLLWLALHIRRVELIGIVIALAMWARYKVNNKVLVSLVIGFIMLQGVMGIVRQNSIAEIFSGDTAIFHGNSNIAALPGGASNVFLSGLHLINEKDSGALSAQQQFTIIQWVRSVVPNQLWNAIGLPSVMTEHTLIFAELDLEYVGGMPLLAAFYLNGGVVFVLLFGISHGLLAKYIERVVEQDFKRKKRNSGSLRMYLVVVFLVYQFRYYWYNPQTLFRAIFFSAILLLVFSVFMKWRKSRSSLITLVDSPLVNRQIH